MASYVIHDADLPRDLKVVVLFDAFHLCPVVAACLTHLALKQASAQGHKKTKTVLRLPPISELKNRMRQVLWREAVENVVKHSHEKPVIRRLEQLLAA
jgi:hypothetical protein